MGQDKSGWVTYVQVSTTGLHTLGYLRFHWRPAQIIHGLCYSGHPNRIPYGISCLYLGNWITACLIHRKVYNSLVLDLNKTCVLSSKKYFIMLITNIFAYTETELWQQWKLHRQDSKANYPNALSLSLLFLFPAFFSSRESNCAYSYYCDQVLYLSYLSMWGLYNNAVSKSQTSVPNYFLFAEGFYYQPHRHWPVWFQETVIREFSAGSGVAATTSQQVHRYLMLACFDEAVGSLGHMCENIWLSFGSFGNEKWRTGCTVQTSWHHSSHFRGGLADTSFLCFWVAPAKSHPRNFWMEKTGYRGSWTLHQTWEPLYCISEKCSFLKKKVTFKHNRPGISVPGATSKRTFIPSTIWFVMEEGIQVFQVLFSCRCPKELLLDLFKAFFCGCYHLCPLPVGCVWWEWPLFTVSK